MQNLDLMNKIVDEVCAKLELDPRIVRRLMQLEGRHQDLQSWGARPTLRREIVLIVEEELQLLGPASTP